MKLWQESELQRIIRGEEEQNRDFKSKLKEKNTIILHI